MFKLYTMILKFRITPYLFISLLVILTTFILWTPFILKWEKIYDIKIENSEQGIFNIIRHWDGPLYIIPAKTLYDKENEILKNKPEGLQELYFAAHFPLYPLTLRFFAPIIGYPKALLASTLFFSILLFCFFYWFIKKHKFSNYPLLLTFVFLCITPRFLVVRSVGSPEPLFLLLILLSIHFFMNKKYLLAGLFGGLSVITKSPGILLFCAYALWMILSMYQGHRFKISWIGIVLIPLGLLSVFVLYFFQYKDFLAYFKSGDNIHLLFPPFKVFNHLRYWVGTAWLEDIIFIYFFYLIAIINNIKIIIKPFYLKIQPYTWFMIVFFTAIISVEHRDISRYALPMLPFALISLEKFFTSKKFIFALILLLPAIYFYAWNFMTYNIAPINDWSPFL